MLTNKALLFHCLFVSVFRLIFGHFPSIMDSNVYFLLLLSFVFFSSLWIIIFNCEEILTLPFTIIIKNIKTEIEGPPDL